nr:pentatricopeptide repeat protein AaPPR412 [Agave angustifolia]
MFGMGFHWMPFFAYKKMVGRGCEVDKFTYPSVLKACSMILDLDLGRVIHGIIEISGLQHDLFIRNALVSMYANCGLMSVARKLFDVMSEKDIVTWNSLISGYSSKGMVEESFELLEKLQLEESKMNTVTLNTIAATNSQMDKHLEALKLIAKMRNNDSSIDSASLVIGLNSCSRIGHLRLGKEIHGLTFRLHYNQFENVNNALITMYLRCKQIEFAYLLFRMRTYKSLITWNAMIAGLAVGTQEEEIFEIFHDMIRSRVQPNYVTLMTVVSICARTNNLRYGQELHCYITKHGFNDYQLLCNSLIDMYSKSGRISVARRVFDMMTDYDRVSYTSMIAGYGMQGEGMKALDLFDKMICCGIKPDGITMVVVLSACGHSGLITHGEMLFEKMFVIYGIFPQMEHYSCMVDLFVRAGFLRNAEEFINHMPFEPSTAMLATLIRACQTLGNREIGERAAKRLLEMRSDDPNHYLLIANMFTYCGKWEELAGVRTIMKDKGIIELYILLAGLFENMRDVEYVGNQDFGV